MYAVAAAVAVQKERRLDQCLAALDARFQAGETKRELGEPIDQP